MKMARLCAWSLFSASLVVAFCNATPRAYAQTADPHAANERFLRGVEAAQHGELARAATEFEAAYALSPKPVVLYNLGQTQSALGRPVEAVRSLRRYLETEPAVAPERRREVEELIRSNERQIGVVELEVVPPNAKLEIDAEPARPDGDKVSLAAGRHVIVGTLDGYAPAVVNVEVIAQADTRARLELHSLTPPPALSLPPEYKPELSQPLEPERPLPAVHDSTRTQSIVALATAGLGIVALGLGTGFALSAHDLAKASEAGGHCDAHGCDEVGYPLDHKAHLRAAWATGLFITGGALLAGGVTWYVVLGSSSRGNAQPPRAASAAR
jgi:hypothetical protein